MQENKPPTQMSLDQPSFETAFEKLQGTVKKLESGELSLEDSLRQFEEGVRLSRICQEHLSSAEQRVEILMKNPSQSDGTLDLQPFRKSSD
jgi:exodeoxyribonuclease VII small subunit